MSAADGRRLGLILANGRYQDPGLNDLHSPAVDARLLGEVLTHPEIAGFTVTSLVDQSAHTMRIGLLQFAEDARPGDVLLVYLSCHGLLDKRQHLYFAGTDTVRDFPGASSVDAQFLLRTLEECRARQQILILDSCFSGAIAEGSKGAPDVGLQHRFPSQARGRVVLTSSTRTEFSFEGARTGDGAHGASTYTAALAEGLRSGLADADGDGMISPEDAHRFAAEQLRDAGATQTPMHWIYEGRGSIVLARATPKPRPPRPREPVEPPRPWESSGADSGPPDPSPPALPSALEPLRELLAAGDLREADRLTTRILLESVRPDDHGPPAAEPPRFLSPTRRSELSEDLLRDLDRLWSAHSRGRHGFSRQLRSYPGPRRGVPPGGAGDFQALCRALGWPAEATAPPEHPDPPEGFFPTLAGVRAADDFEWYENWKLTVMTVHRRLREADHPR